MIYPTDRPQLHPDFVPYGTKSPVPGNKSILERALRKAGNKNVTVRILPKGDHALMLSETGSSTEFPYLHEFVRGLFQMMVDWIRLTIS
jgi:hypothetical protein